MIGASCTFMEQLMKTTVATALCVLALAGTVSLAEPGRGDRHRDRDGDPRDMPAAAVERGRGGAARGDERRSEAPRSEDRRSYETRGGNIRGPLAAAPDQGGRRGGMSNEPPMRESRAPADTWRGGGESRGDNVRGSEPRARGPLGEDSRGDESRGGRQRWDNSRGGEARDGDARVAPPRLANNGDDRRSHRDGRRDYGNDYRRDYGRRDYRDNDRYQFSYWDQRGRGWRYEPRWYQSYRHSHFRYYGGRYYGRERFYISFYVFPRGFAYRNWRVGEYMPYSYYYNARYDLDDYWRYDLYDPPYWAHWVRVGNDALLIDYDTREVIDVVYDLFY
jgi:hypothetical protein